MRSPFRLLFLLIVTSTSYGQIENLLLLPLGSPQSIVLDSAARVLGSPIASEHRNSKHDRMIRYSVPFAGSLFGIPVDSANFSFRDGELERVDVIVVLDSVPNTLRVDQTILRYMTTRLGPLVISRCHSEYEGDNYYRPKAPEGYVIIESRRRPVPSKQFTISVSHRPTWGYE